MVALNYALERFEIGNGGVKLKFENGDEFFISEFEWRELKGMCVRISREGNGNPSSLKGCGH